MATLYLDQVIQDGFAGHVTVESVVSMHEVRSEMLQHSVQVHRVVTDLLTAVDALTTLKNLCEYYTQICSSCLFTAAWLSNRD